MDERWFYKYAMEYVDEHDLQDQFTGEMLYFAAKKAYKNHYGMDMEPDVAIEDAVMEIANHYKVKVA